MKDLIYKDEVYSIIGAAMEVHNELGYGFLEAVYQEALSIELREKNIPFEKEKEIEFYYKDLFINYLIRGNSCHWWQKPLQH